MPDDNRVIQRTASVEDRVDAIQAVRSGKGDVKAEGTGKAMHTFLRIFQESH